MANINDAVSWVLAGKYGNGADRIARLKAAWFDPTAVQNAVNAKLWAKTTTKQSTNNWIWYYDSISGRWVDTSNGDGYKNQDDYYQSFQEFHNPTYSYDAYANKTMADGRTYLEAFNDMEKKFMDNPSAYSEEQVNALQEMRNKLYWTSSDTFNRWETFKDAGLNKNNYLNNIWFKGDWTEYENSLMNPARKSMFDKSPTYKFNQDQINELTYLVTSWQLDGKDLTTEKLYNSFGKDWFIGLSNTGDSNTSQGTGATLQSTGSLGNMPAITQRTTGYSVGNGRYDQDDQSQHGKDAYAYSSTWNKQWGNSNASANTFGFKMFNL